MRQTCSNSGFRPAINAGLSVSRVGGAAQTQIIKKLGGGVRLSLAQYRELAAFAQFASDLDEATRKQLERGQRVMELMKQKQYAPLSIAEMAISLYAAEHGYLDDIPLEKISAFEAALQAWCRAEKKDMIDSINREGKYDDTTETQLKGAVSTFKGRRELVSQKCPLPRKYAPR